MASYQAIAATGQAILGLLADARPNGEFTNAQFDLYQSSSFQTPMEEGISLYLYRVSLNGSRRNLSPRPESADRRRRPPLPLDLHYLLTPWAKTPAKQHRLLGWAMRTLADSPILPSNLLNSPGPETGIFQPDETVELICEPLALQDAFNLWEGLKTKVQPSITYVARLVAIQSELELPVLPLVQTRGFDLAEGPTG